MSREGNRDTLKVECMLKPRDAKSVTFLMLKRELESVDVNCENLKTGKHGNKREKTRGEMTVDEKIAHERTGHATYDPRCETWLKVRQHIHEKRHLRKLHTWTTHLDFCILLTVQIVNCF